MTKTELNKKIDAVFNSVEKPVVTEFLSELPAGVLVLEEEASEGRKIAERIVSPTGTIGIHFLGKVVSVVLDARDNEERHKCVTAIRQMLADAIDTALSAARTPAPSATTGVDWEKIGEGLVDRLIENGRFTREWHIGIQDIGDFFAAKAKESLAPKTVDAKAWGERLIAYLDGKGWAGFKRNVGVIGDDVRYFIEFVDPPKVAPASRPLGDELVGEIRNMRVDTDDGVAGGEYRAGFEACRKRVLSRMEKNK